MSKLGQTQFLKRLGELQPLLLDDELGYKSTKGEGGEDFLYKQKTWKSWCLSSLV